MYTEQDYLYGWLFYLIGVCLIMLCGWLLTAKLRWPVLRHVLRLVVGVTLVVPWYASPELDYLAPAWLIAGFEGIFEGEGAFWRAGTAVVWSVTCALGLYVLATCGWWYLKRSPAE